MHKLVIPQDHPCFPGHFPGEPILPGVLLLERVLSLLRQQCNQELSYYKIQNVKFLSAVMPSDCLHIDLTSTGEQGYNFTVFKMNNDIPHQQMACSGQLRWSLS
jgi:3-hydroxymyristoyl/3-hydroxydecanoyl-(acyl carrier protein) dehydratase